MITSAGSEEMSVARAGVQAAPPGIEPLSAAEADMRPPQGNKETSALTLVLTILRSAALPPPHAMRLRSLLASLLSLTSFAFIVVGVLVRPLTFSDA